MKEPNPPKHPSCCKLISNKLKLKTSFQTTGTRLRLILSFCLAALKPRLVTSVLVPVEKHKETKQNKENWLGILNPLFGQSVFGTVAGGQILCNAVFFCAVMFVFNWDVYQRGWFKLMLMVTFCLHRGLRKQAPNRSGSSPTLYSQLEIQQRAVIKDLCTRVDLSVWAVPVEWGGCVWKVSFILWNYKQAIFYFFGGFLEGRKYWKIEQCLPPHATEGHMLKDRCAKARPMLTAMWCSTCPVFPAQDAALLVLLWEFFLLHNRSLKIRYLHWQR